MPASHSRERHEVLYPLEYGNAGNQTTEHRQRVTILSMKNALFTSSSVQVIKLRHPRTQGAAMFVYNSDEKEILELMSFDEGHRNCYADLRAPVRTRLDPPSKNFLLTHPKMPATQNVPLEDLLDDPDFPAVRNLPKLKRAQDLSHIADRKGSADLGVWKYNEESTLTWLERRVERLASVLKEKKVPTSSGQSFTFVRTMDQTQTIEAYKVLAHGIVSEYLPDDLSQILHKHLNLPKTSNKKPAASGAENQPPNKKPKVELPSEDYTSKKVEGVPKTPVQQTAKSKALAKSATGSKNIMSFFSKK
ncbi:unnamed protein product, partial [Meganyctiphanes norvegica]